MPRKPIFNTEFNNCISWMETEETFFNQKMLERFILKYPDFFNNENAERILEYYCRRLIDRTGKINSFTKRTCMPNVIAHRKAKIVYFLEVIQQTKISVKDLNKLPESKPRLAKLNKNIFKAKSIANKLDVQLRIQFSILHSKKTEVIRCGKSNHINLINLLLTEVMFTKKELWLNRLLIFFRQRIKNFPKELRGRPHHEPWNEFLNVLRDNFEVDNIKLKYLLSDIINLCPQLLTLPNVKNYYDSKNKNDFLRLQSQRTATSQLHL